MESDRLHQIFQLMLQQTHDMEETAAQFIRRVSDAYATELLGTGGVPGQFVASVLEDLEAEILEMYRKKTYGYFSLRAFREERILFRAS